MINTYGTIDFEELFDSLQTEIDRLKTGYCVYDLERAEKINDYNRITTTLLILKEIKSR